MVDAARRCRGWQCGCRIKRLESQTSVEGLLDILHHALNGTRSTAYFLAKAQTAPAKARMIKASITD